MKNEKIVNELVDAFLSWNLPDDFCPDAGISFNKYTFANHEFNPIGTNLFTATQAKAMFEYLLNKSPAFANAIEQELCSGEAVARYIARRLTPDGTDEFFGIALTEAIPPLSLLYLAPPQVDQSARIKELEADKLIKQAEIDKLKNEVKILFDGNTAMFNQITKLTATNKELEAECALYKDLLKESRDDCAEILNNYFNLLPFKKYRYDAQKELVKKIDEALGKAE